jgi:hypothetical protein
MIRIFKHLILKFIVTPMDRHGLLFAMPRKNVPRQVHEEIMECRPRSFCPYQHFVHAYHALDHIESAGIPGDIVLCGVATGGMAKFLSYWARGNRRLWLYDTFDGGPLPGVRDGEFERKHGEAIKRAMVADLSVVRPFVESGYSGRPAIEWIVGDIMQTVPSKCPGSIALLYLDTDWYDSTRHELIHLEPRVSLGGVIIQDDMGLCVGAAEAVHEYYKGKTKPFIVPIDESGRIWIKA